ncbi:HIT family protein [Weissella coleopterorum]|uniref:HIT family protein n=1 Tax=Weissella coleopterorum TaxID=2714949 RepID=A0A6G8AYT9_9LACO|nr:HIT family protein [Weissella coleopterorum]QIL50157.1 HIT family protein [Weissella coleopterorum]
MTEMPMRVGCFYCEHNAEQDSKMTAITSLSVSTVYLNHDQTYAGRVIVALNWHVDEMFELTDGQRNAFFKDVSIVAQVLMDVFWADKINYGIYGDLVSHLHVHMVPKKKSEAGFGEAFTNNPGSIKVISPAQEAARIEQLRKLLEEAADETF